MTAADGTGGLAHRLAPLKMSPDEFRDHGHRMVDRIAALFEGMPERRVAPDTKPAEIRGILGRGDLPRVGADPSHILEEATALLFEWSRFNSHPRYWGYIGGCPAPISVLSDLLATAIDQNVVMWNSGPMAAEIEAQTVRWLAELIGYPSDCGGLFVSGGTMANFVGLHAARRTLARWDVRKEGMAGAPAPLRIYASEETHTWLQKTADMAGLGTDAIRWIEIDGERRLKTSDLEARLADDLKRGDLPFLVIGSAGTVSTGAIDPLPRIAEIGRQHGMWFHVDGAYGAPAAVLADAPPDLLGLREADSIALDPHKWLYSPFEAGCVLVRDRQALVEAFGFRPSYYHMDYPPGEEPIHYYEQGPQNTRAFRALKVWTALRQAGRDGYRQMIEDDIRLSQELYRQADTEPELEAGTQSLSIATFRYVPKDLDPAHPEAEAYLNTLNAALLSRLQRGGEAYMSNAVIDGRYLLRACIVNFHAQLGDIRVTIDVVLRIGAAVDAELRPPALRPGA